MSSTRISRRSFITTASLGAAGLLGATALGSCAQSETASPDSKADANWDAETDVVVVGSGTAGLVTAVTAIEAGVDVTMIEKTDLVGGVSSACVQYCAPGSRSLNIPQPFDDVEDSADIMFNDAMRLSDGTADATLVKIRCDNAASGIDWLVDHGCEFRNALKISEGRHGQGKFIAASAGEVTSKLIPIVEQSGTVMSSCALQSIVRSENGRITGVVCSKAEGDTISIGARKAVVLCTGMWTNDETLLARHMYEIPQVFQEAADCFASLGMPYGPFTGEAILAAQAVGAAVRHMEYNFIEACYSRADLMSQGVAVAGITRVVGQMLVGSNGKRFADEGATRGALGHAAQKLQDGVFYPILDGHIVPSQMNPKEEVLQKWIDGGFVARADTLEEVAVKAQELFGIPSDALVASIVKYNEGCASGSDEFGKDPHFMTPIDTAPFTVGPVETCGLIYTHGGLDADTNARVKDINGEVIPGLYAAGMCTGGHFGTDTVSGDWQMDSVVFGRIAGANAAAE